MNTVFNMTVFPDTSCERKLVITIGKIEEVNPKFFENNPAYKGLYAYEITASGNATNSAHYGFEKLHDAQANALLQAAAYGNGGFPLNSHLR